MNANMVKHIVEIAGGLVLGGLASDAVNGVGKIVKRVVNNKKHLKKIKKKGV